MTQGGSSDMLEKMRDALKRAAQSLQAVKEENKRLHDQLDDANATILELQLELAALKKRMLGVEQDDAEEPAPASPPTKRAKAAQARRQSKKSQVTSAVQSWLAPAALLPQVSLPKPVAPTPDVETEPVDLQPRRPSSQAETPPQAHTEPAKQETAREAAPPPVTRSGFFSGITAHNATFHGSDTSDEETDGPVGEPVGEPVGDPPGEPCGEPLGEPAVLGEEEAAADEQLLVPAPSNAASPEEEGLQPIDVPNTQTHSKFVSLLLKQLSMATYARVAHHLATDKRAQSIDVIVAELLSYLRDQCQDLPQPYADYIHEVLPHGADQAQTMLSIDWLTRACEKALRLPAREPLLSAAACVAQLVLSISRHPSKGLTFYDQVTDQLSRELLAQSASSNVVGLRARAWDPAEAEGEDEDRDGYDEYKYADQPLQPAEGGESKAAESAEVPMESDHESNAESDEFLDVEVLPGGNGSIQDGPVAGSEGAVRSEVASVFAELDALSDLDEEEEEEEEEASSAAPCGETTSGIGTVETPAPSEPPTAQPVHTPAPKLQQTTLRKERADWRIALLTAVVLKLYQSRPLPWHDKAKVLVWDVLKASVPHVPSGFLYGLAITAPELHSTIDLSTSFAAAPSLSTSQVAGGCVFACLRQILTTAARRPRERFWLFRFLGFLVEWQKRGDSGQGRIGDLIQTLVSTDLPVLYSQLASTVRTMIENASADSAPADRAGVNTGRHALKSTLRLTQLTKGVLNEIGSRSGGGLGDTMFDPAFQIACRAVGWVSTLQQLEELGVLERACIGSQLRSLLLREQLPWNRHDSQILLSRTLPPSVATFRAPTSWCSPGSGLVESWVLQSMDIARLTAGGHKDLEQFLRAAQVVLSAVSAWSAVLPDAFPHAAVLSSATAGNCPLELGLELPAAQLRSASQEDMDRLNVTLSGGVAQADRIEVVFYDNQYSAHACPAVSSGHQIVSGAFTARQVAAVPLVALLRTRCLARALARKVLELTSLQDAGSRTFMQLTFCAARYLLLFDDQPAAVRADLLDQVLRAMRSLYHQQGDDHAHVPRDLLRFTSHTLSTRAVGHVISLDRRADRWHRMLKMARKARLLLYRHAAVDGSKGDRDISERDVTLSWDSFVNAKFDEKCVASTNVTMSPSERACASSHLQLWREFDSGKLCGLQAGRFDSPIMLVFEDDAKVKTENLAERIADILTELPSNFDICYLGCIVPSNAKRIKWSSQLVVPEYAWQLHAYLLSRAGARKLLNQLPISAPVDNFVAELAMTGMLHTFAVKQSLVTQHKVISQQAARGSIDTDIRHSGRIVGAGVFS